MKAIYILSSKYNLLLTYSQKCFMPIVTIFHEIQIDGNIILDILHTYIFVRWCWAYLGK